MGAKKGETTYKKISAEKQIGISKIQSFLREDGYLVDKTPTQLAYDDNIIARTEPYEDGSFQVIFKYTELSNYLENKGYVGEHATRIGNGHQAIDRIIEAGNLFIEIYGGDTDLADIFYNWILEYPGIPYILMDKKYKEYGRILQGEKERILHRYNPNRLSQEKKNKFELAMKKINACITWLNKKR